jgi:hypothetical protein
MMQLIDLTKINVSIEFSLDTIDTVLLVVTGGVGYLARQAYLHFNGRENRNIELQRQNFINIVEEAQSKGAQRILVRLSPSVPIYAPRGGAINYLDRCDEYCDIEVTLP